jgi:peroxiredoxin
MSDPPRLAVGSPAPDLVLASSTGTPVRLSEYRAQSNLVLFFLRAFT